MNPNRSNVAHVVSTYLFRHGTWIYGQIAHLEAWRPVVLCHRTENLDSFPVKTVHSTHTLPFLSRYYNKLSKRMKGYYPYFKEKVSEEGVDLIHAHFGPIGYATAKLAELCEVPLITSFYGYDLSRLPCEQPHWHRRYQRLFAAGTLFLVEGHHMRQQLMSLGCPSEKIILQHLGVNSDSLPFKPRKPNPDGTIRILIAAAFTEKKGVPYAMEAFAKLCQAYDNLRLTVIGDARPQEDEQRIKKQLLDIVSRYGIEEKVTFMGSQPYDVLIEQYYRHHIFLSPSVQAADGDNEGGAPLTIIEALATGMPVISTRHCDIPEVFQTAEADLLAEERDVNGLVARLEWLLENCDGWMPFLKMARRHIDKEYDARIQGLRLSRLYRELLGHN